MARCIQYGNSLVAYDALLGTQHLQTPSTSPPHDHSYNSPTAMPYQQGASHQHETESHGGVNTLDIYALTEHFGRVTAASQQVFLDRLSKQDAVLSKQQELLDSLVNLYTGARTAAVEEHETLRIEISDLRKMTDRLTRGISDAMKTLASGTINAISECQTKFEARLFCAEESCEGLKEEVMDPPADFPTLEVAMGSDSPIREMSYCGASTRTPKPVELETLSSVHQADLSPSLQGTMIPHEDELVLSPTSLELGPTIASEEDELASTLSDSSCLGLHPTTAHDEEEPSSPRLNSPFSESNPITTHMEELSLSRSNPTTTMEELVSMLLNRQFSELSTTFGHGEKERVSNAPFPDPLLGSSHASTISLPDASTLLYNHLNRLSETVPPIPSASVSSTTSLCRVDSLSSLSPLSSDDACSELSETAPKSSDKYLRDAVAGFSTTAKRRYSSPGSSGKFTKRPRNNSLRPGLTVSSDAESRQFIQCDKCELWYHWGCVGIRNKDPRLQDDESFKCPPCLSGIGTFEGWTPPDVCDVLTSSLDNPSKGQKGTCSRPGCSIEDSAVEEYFVDKIIGRFGGVNRYSWLVKWEGYPAEDATWTPEGELIDPTKLIEDFYIAAEAEGIPKTRSSLTLLREAVEAGWANRLE